MSDKSNWPLVKRCLKGNEDALLFLQYFDHVVNVWDDLIDEDKPVQKRHISSAFEAAMVHMPRSRFFREHAAELQPLIEVTIANWHASNAMQASGVPEEVARAHTLRFTAVDVIVMCCRLIGGQSWANECALELRRAYPRETLEDFIKEMAK